MFFYQSTLAVVETKHYATKPGERAKVTLSDGTQIWLNAGSFLKYPKEFKGYTREVYLTGEAFFDVAKDKKHPFIIHTDKMDTKVLGTSFNVQAYPDQTTQEVSVLTGRVNVKSTVTEENVYVTPGQKVVFKSKNNKLQAFKDIPVNTISLWRKNIMVFEETPLPEVIATINRNYNVAVEIKNKNLNTLKINAYFKELTADQVVALVCNIVNAEYKVEGGVYKIQ
jgi:ferric-dicitrate binding protein FerR (iron transport regulator)